MNIADALHEITRAPYGTHYEVHIAITGGRWYVSIPVLPGDPNAPGWLGHGDTLEEAVEMVARLRVEANNARAGVR